MLIIRGSLEKTAEKFSLSTYEVKAILRDARAILYDVRQKRPAPHLDNKMIAAWNGNHRVLIALENSPIHVHRHKIKNLECSSCIDLYEYTVTSHCIAVRVHCSYCILV